MAGIVSYGAYVPYFRLDRRAITATLGSGGGKGSRSVASFDEDTTSMGVEAARKVLRPDDRPNALLFATSDPAYLDKTNANAIHAALGLEGGVFAVDAGGAVRSGVGATMAAVSWGNALVVTADTRSGLPGGVDESNGGDAAAALLFGSDRVVAELVAHASATAEFLDRWRLPGAVSSGQWEERFGESEYVPLAESAVTAALKQAGLTAEQLDHALVTGVHTRAVGVIAKSLGTRPGALAEDLTGLIGNTGTAHANLLLCDVLDRAGGDELIMTVSVADGVDVAIWRTTAALAGYRDARTSATVRAQIDAGNGSLTYAQFLTWKGQIRREPARRPDPDRVSAPASSRANAWKFGFSGSRCLLCSKRHLPPVRVCVKCQSVDQMTVERVADVPGTIATFTIDRLAFSMSPPVVGAIVDFDGGGRFMCEMTDLDPSEVKIGGRVEMTFRRLNTAQGIHNYFWKARPIR